tara:strand:+ start:3087 stop:3785 length:699 start_codon:yes stop_codon:yes gene_type:complete
MIENVLLAKEIYKGWKVRIHYNDTVPIKVVEWLGTQDNVMMIHHEGSGTVASNMFWRFYDLFIPNTVVLIRDADSRLSLHEKDMVDEWLNSSKDFHVIRGHPDHKVPILGGTCGCRNNLLEYIHVSSGLNNVNASCRTFVSSKDFLNGYIGQVPSKHDKYNIDQIFLYQYIYPIVASSLFVHSVKESAYEPFAKIIETMVTAFIGEIVTECPLASQIMGDERTVFIREPAYK